MNTRLLLLALLLSGCAANSLVAPASAWTPDESWWAEASRSGGTFTSKDGSIRIVPALHATNVIEVSRKLQAHSAIAAGVTLTDVDELNAFATDSNGARVVALSFTLLDAIGHDRDALATSIGHEMAHLHYAHAAARKQRNRVTVGGTGETANIAVDTSFSRFEEREADIKGMQWAVAAGFSPCGSARTIRLLRANAGGADGGTFLSTHPGHGERIARANAMSKELTGEKF